uniref:EF-hand domain-containing protein n=1 Tax=Branchiostoma floridae TaxID=7739 RepID=C3YER0_BRAFL|eukprot:XP_002605144.1 hypothetical protein BRAFLDRAFT_122715 [Branchiostoma floridae]
MSVSRLGVQGGSLNRRTKSDIGVQRPKSQYLQYRRNALHPTDSNSCQSSDSELDAAHGPPSKFQLRRLSSAPGLATGRLESGTNQICSTRQLTGIRASNTKSSKNPNATFAVHDIAEEEEDTEGQRADPNNNMSSMEDGPTIVLNDAEEAVVTAGADVTGGPQNEESFREVFDLFDRTGGGTFDAEELDEALRSVNICLDKDELVDVIYGLDKDGNGEIDFDEFLALMTNTERFLESLADEHQGVDGGSSQILEERRQRKEREGLLFQALTQFMKKSAIIGIGEIVGYFRTKYNKAPHVVQHYAAGARLIGLTEKQLHMRLEDLHASSKEQDSASPYAQPLNYKFWWPTLEKKRKKTKEKRSHRRIHLVKFIKDENHLHNGQGRKELVTNATKSYYNMLWYARTKESKRHWEILDTNSIQSKVLRDQFAKTYEIYSSPEYSRLTTGISTHHMSTHRRRGDSRAWSEDTESERKASSIVYASRRDSNFLGTSRERALKPKGSTASSETANLPPVTEDRRLSEGSRPPSLGTSESRRKSSDMSGGSRLSGTTLEDPPTERSSEGNWRNFTNSSRGQVNWCKLFIVAS